MIKVVNKGLLNNCTIHKFKFDTYEQALKHALMEGLN